MDLNYLYHRHQVSLFLAENARCDRSRAVHDQLAHAYAQRIGELQSHHRLQAAA